jgi:hypothetical protein
MTQARPDRIARHDASPAPDPRTRYAIYFTPRPDTALWRFGSRILGYDSATGEQVPQPRLHSITPERLEILTRRPRVYGFHATIKPPIRLAEGCDEAGLIAALDAFCTQAAPVTLAPLVLAELGPDGEDAAFLALVERGMDEGRGQTPALRDLEARVVEAFEPFRAPLTAEEYARRNPQSLPPRKRELLDRYGYPGVLDAFTFHMTLSGRIPGAERAALSAELADLWRETARDDPARDEPVVIDHLGLCRQMPGEPFRILHRSAFARSRA